jgi:hypothetical protein
MVTAMSAWRPRAWVVPAILCAAAITVLCFAGWHYGYDPGWLAHTHAWWTRLLAPGQNWAPAGTLILGAAGLAGFWWPRRHERRPIGLLIVVVMVVVAAALGTTSYVPCHGTMGVTGVIFWVLQLYVGQPPNVYQPPYLNVAQPTPHGSAAAAAIQACTGAPPPALQLAQIVGLGATLIGFVALGMVLWREPVQRLQSRFTAHATVFTGLDTLTLPVLRRLTRVPNPQAIIVIEPDETNQLLDEARATGARVIMGEPTSRGLLEPIISGWRGCALDRLYALSARVPENERVIKAAGEILLKYTPAPDRQTLLVARIDDPRHAEAWRGRHSRTDGSWFEDALSPAEATARTVVGRALATGQRYLLICGDSTLTLAILTELARRAWERATLINAAVNGRPAGQGGTTDPLPPAPVPFPVERVTLLDARAERIRREFRESTPKEILKAAPRVEVAGGLWRDQLLGRLDAMSKLEAGRTAVIIVDGPDEESAHEAGRVARLHQKTPVFILAAPGAGMREAIFDLMHPFERELLMDNGTVPDDSWTRIARHWHELYRLSRPPAAPGEKGAAKRLPWQDLTPTVRDANILQVRSILKLVSEQNRVWVPIRMVPSGSHVELNASEIAVVARMEHRRWLDLQTAEDRGNPNARPWDSLTREQRESSCALVISQIQQLAAVGFLPTIPRGGPAGTKSFERTGTVWAKRLSSRMPWRLRPDEELHGKPGDWHVRDAAGNERTIADPEFQVSHEALGNGQWRRVGTFPAWQILEDHVVWTKEGTISAKAGNWIVEGSGGERWPVGDDQFRRTYRLVEDAPPRHDNASAPAATSNSAAAANST